MKTADVAVIIDATYFERGDGMMLCRTATENIYWKPVMTECIEDYAACIDAAISIGRRVIAATVDGRRGVRQMLERRGIIVQFCQFHQIALVKRHIPAKAKTEAARALRCIALRLCSMCEIQCETALSTWHILYGDFLRERTYDTVNKRCWQYTHRRLRSAWRSLHNNLSYLFAFERYPKLKIPNTTNYCDGLFAHLKERIGIHRGLSRARKMKMLHYLLEEWFK